MRKIVAASQNKHKIREIEEITKEFGMFIIPRDEAGVPDVEIVEDGETFETNSYKKAYEVMKLCGEITIADDSGLEVDYLDGDPGVRSARFAGEDPEHCYITFRLEGVDEETLIPALKAEVEEVVHVCCAA